MTSKFPLRLPLASVVLVIFLSVSAFAQTKGTLRGLVSDELGAAIVGANVTLTDSTGAQKKTTSNGEGVYTFSGLTPGVYQLQAVAPGFSQSTAKDVNITGQRQSVDVTLKVTIEEKVEIAAEQQISTDSTANANQQVLAGKDLDALPDDPDQLAAALQALAGPSVGPNGGQIFIDGFSGGSLPSKDSIREIRINQNPFAAENDQPSARIDVLTRPGTDKFRGGASFNFNDESLNSRNPFAVTSSKRAPYQQRQYDFNFSGPLIPRKASYFIGFGRGENNDSELIRAKVLDGSLNPIDLGQGFLVPRRNTFFSPRFDYAINTNNTLIVRYNLNRFKATDQGVGGFNLPERGFNTVSTNHTVQLTETAILNPTTVTETRFQYSYNKSEQDGGLAIPALDVSASFGSGDPQVNGINTRKSWELNNFTAKQISAHAVKFGGRVRHVSVDDTNRNNYGGRWIFNGAFNMTSLERYRLTLQLQRQGLTPAQIRAQGGGASTFSISSGNPFADVTQTDYGVFIQDDWRVKPNLTLSYGLRYETQTNAHSKYDFAPRLAVAWSPGAGNGAKPPKMVIRAGTGVFYNRFSEGSTLTARRFNGVNVVQTVVTENVTRDDGGQIVPPTVAQQQDPRFAAIYNVLNQFSPTSVPSVAGIAANQQTTWLVDPNLQIPTLWVAGTQVERQLPRNITMFVGFYNIRIVHVIRARDVNAPLPGTITAANPFGVRPNPAKGDINQFEASGQFNQRQFFVGFNNRLSRTITLNGNYSSSKSTNDTDGQGGSLFPVNSYDASGEFGRSGFDVRHRFTLIGTVNLPWWKLVVNPFVQASSGPPFNITTGQDSNLDRQANERPSFAGANPDCSNQFIRCTRFGNFNLRPAPGEALIPRNYGSAPGSFSLNLNISRTFAFGTVHRSNAAAQAARPANAGPGGPGGPGGGPVAVVAAGGGAARVAGVGPGGGGPVGPQSGASAEKRFNLNVSLQFQNLLNNVNLSAPVGNLLSPNFGQSLGLGGSFGGFGGLGGGGSNAGNRRIFLRMRLNF